MSYQLSAYDEARIAAMQTAERLAKTFADIRVAAFLDKRPDMRRLMESVQNQLNDLAHEVKLMEEHTPVTPEPPAQVITVATPRQRPPRVAKEGAATNSYLSDDTVRAIRAAASPERTYSDIAREFNIKPYTVSLIIQRKRYVNVPDEPVVEQPTTE